MTPTVVIPGLQGSSLQNKYPVPTETSWSMKSLIEQQLTAVDFDTVGLSQSGEDASLTTLNYAESIFGFPYAPLMSALRGKLGAKVYSFSYDWRLSLVDSAQELHYFLKRLTRKLSNSSSDWDGKFNFVCHSFGGLVFRGLLDKVFGEIEGLVNKVVFIGVPHRGSIDAVDALVRGHSPAFGGRKEMRKLARTFPSVYELLPTYEGALKSISGSDLDVFSVDSWQRNTTASKKRYSIEQFYLDNAKEALSAAPMPVGEDYLDPSQCLSIVGTEKASTFNSLSYVKDSGHLNDSAGGQGWLDFDDADKSIGDDVVLLNSSHLPKVDYVWLDRAAVPYFTLAMFTSLHAALPAIDEVHTIIGRFLSGVKGPDILPRSLPKWRYAVGV